MHESFANQSQNRVAMPEASRNLRVKTSPVILIQGMCELEPTFLRRLIMKPSFCCLSANSPAYKFPQLPTSFRYSICKVTPMTGQTRHSSQIQMSTYLQPVSKPGRSLDPAAKEGCFQIMKAKGRLTSASEVDTKVSCNAVHDDKAEGLLRHLGSQGHQQVCTQS